MLYNIILNGNIIMKRILIVFFEIIANMPLVILAIFVFGIFKILIPIFKVKSYIIELSESEFLWLHKLLKTPIVNCNPDSELMEDKEYRRGIYHPINLVALDRLDRLEKECEEH